MKDRLPPSEHGETAKPGGEPKKIQKSLAKVAIMFYVCS